ncbi:hypothetical protein QW131_28060 [Roseibium salinum]|nr:hypothetical protein [Roseibium salinum]
MQIPILGSLFKSRDFLRNQTELAVFVTPYVVQPIAEQKMVRPDKKTCCRRLTLSRFFSQPAKQNI